MNDNLSNNRLNCFYQNSRSIRNKIDDLSSLISTEHFHIIQLTESWITPVDLDILDLLNNTPYSPFYSMRSEGRGGGVLTLVKSSLNPTRIQIDSRLEMVIIKITDPISLYLINFYNPNSAANWVEELADIITDLYSKHNATPIILNGDFNSPNWSPLLSNRSPQDIDILLAETSLTQLVQFPTRGNNFLDLLFSKNIEIMNICPISWFITDHTGFSYDIPTTKAIASTIETFTTCDFQKTPWNQVNAELEYLHSLIINIREPMEAYNKWHKEICLIIDKYVPKRKIKKRHSPPWFDEELKRKNRRKLGAHKKWKINRDIENFRNFCTLRDNFKQTFKTKKYQYIRMVASQISVNPKLFWRTFNFKSKTTQNTKSLPTISELGQFFSQTVNSPYVIRKLPAIKPLSSNVLSRVHTTTNEVLSLLEHADLARKFSPDHIHGAVLYNARFVLAKTLAYLFNAISGIGYFPDQWKISNVFPLFKSGNPKLAKNYRPIALQPLIAKCYEKIIQLRMACHVKNVITPNQHFCVKNRSTTTNLLSTVNHILKYWEQHKDTAIFYADLSKAFDTVDHTLLLHKLSTQFGITNPLLETIKNSLTSRTFRVTMHSEKSNLYKITTGVPQGGVLSPLLFTLFVNDLHEAITPNNVLLQYADDSKLIAAGATPQEALDNLTLNIKNISDWCKKWGLALNPSKSQICIFSQKNNISVSSPEILGDPIQVKDKIKDLGVWMDQKLTFKHHINTLNLRLRSMLGIFYRNYKFLSNTSGIKSLYYALVQSQIDYGLPVWGGAAPSLLEPLKASQKRIYKLMLNIPKFDHNYSYEDISRRLQIPTLHERRIYLSLSIGYNILVKGAFDEYLALPLRIPTYNSRSRELFVIPFSRLATTKRFFKTAILEILNKLPEDCDPFFLDKIQFLSKLRRLLPHLM